MFAGWGDATKLEIAGGFAMQVGTIQIVPILDHSIRQPLGEIVTHTGGVQWDCVHHPTDVSGRIQMSIGAFLLKVKDRTILIDAGMGPDDPSNPHGQLLENLSRYGVGADEVTDVVFTHLHHDHVGGATRRGKVTFPRATFRVHEADWHYFVSGPDAANAAYSAPVEKLTPLEPQLEVFSSEVEIVPGLIARPAPGHTPGSTIFMVADGGERAMLLGDVVHTVGELTDPHWHGLYDVNPVAARAMRDSIVDELAESGDAFAPAHLPELRFGRLISSGSERRFDYVG
jgi:glyoxylase-like metal-dependent hydrolase (beta-lactamase superfamily II)